MNGTAKKARRATPKRTRKRPAFTVIRSRDLPDPPPPPTPGKVSLAWRMDCIGCSLVWPVPAKPGDLLVFNDFGIRRHRKNGPILERDVVFPPLLETHELDRLQHVGALFFREQWDANQFSRFHLWLTGRGIGIDTDRFITPPRAS